MNDATMKAKRTCPRCGGTNMEQEFRTQTVEYRGLFSPPYRQFGLWCQNCNEGLISFNEMEAGDLELRKLKILADQTDVVHPDAAA